MLALLDLDDSEDIDEALRKLPETVEGSYKITIDRINRTANKRKDFARTIFAWISYAYRPLKARELSHAIATQLHKTVSKKEKILSKERITSFCCGLVETDSDDVVRFIHYSAEHFFRDRKEQEYPEFPKEIPTTCAEYLVMIPPEQKGALKGTNIFVEDRMSKTLEDFPFASYAAEYLHQHFQPVRHQLSEELSLAIDDLIGNTTKRDFYYGLLSRSGSYFIRSALLDRDKEFESEDDESEDEDEGNGNGSEDVEADESDEGTKEDRENDPKSHSLHLATFLGHSELVKSLIRRGSVISEPDAYGQSPLTIALKRDFGDIVEVLLDNGALVNLSQRRGHVILLYAAQRNFGSAVEKILERNKEAEYTGSFVDLVILLISPLLLLLYICRTAVHQLISSPIPEPQPFIPGEADELLGHYGFVLALAYRGDTEKLEHFLVTQPRNVDEKILGDGLKAHDFLNTACFLAVERGHKEIVELLLKHGVVADLKNFHGQPLLHRAVSRNYIALVELLLKNGASVDLIDGNNRTAYTAHADRDHRKGTLNPDSAFRYI